MKRQIEFGDTFEKWQKCKNNPIKDISFEYFKNPFTCIRTKITFYNEPDTIYYFSDITSSADNSYIKPVEAIKTLLPENLQHKINYYYTLYGTLIILKGSIYDFPIDKLMSYFNIEKLSYDKYALYNKRHKQRVPGIINYLKEAARSL